jgi:hypothetical protein
MWFAYLIVVAMNIRKINDKDLNWNISQINAVEDKIFSYIKLRPPVMKTLG